MDALGNRQRRRASSQPPARLLVPAPTDLARRDHLVAARVDSPAPAYTGTPASENGDRIIADRSLWTLYGNSLLELYPEATRERHRQQVSEIAADLRPIATPFNAAVTAIRRTIPVGRAPEKGRPRASLVPHSTSRTIS